MDAESIRQYILSSRPPVIVLTLPGHEAVSFRALTVNDHVALSERLDLPPVELAVETLANQAEGLPDAASVLRQLPRPTLLRLLRSWAADPNTFDAAPSLIRSFSDFKLVVKNKEDEWGRQIQKSITDQFSSLMAETQKIVSEIDCQLTGEMMQQVQAIVASLDSLGSEFEDDARELGKRGWTMPTWAPIDWVRCLAKFPAEQLDAGMQREYSRRRNECEKELLARLIDSSALLHWRPLLSECINAYRKRQYRVVVPSLLTVVEGAVLSAKDLRLWKDPKRVATEQGDTRDPGTIRAAWFSVEAFLGEVFAKHDFSDPRRPLINRHWICHGRDVPEWGRIDCLRLFQALDTISTIIRIQPPKAKI